MRFPSVAAIVQHSTCKVGILKVLSEEIVVIGGVYHSSGGILFTVGGCNEISGEYDGVKCW